MYFLQFVSILSWTNPFKPGQSSPKPGSWSLYSEVIPVKCVKPLEIFVVYFTNFEDCNLILMIKFKLSKNIKLSNGHRRSMCFLSNQVIDFAVDLAQVK